MVRIEEVPMWDIWKNIGHAVMWRKHGMTFWACNRWTSCGGDETKVVPSRICRKCRANLNTLSLDQPKS